MTDDIIIHEIHDLSNRYVTDLLVRGISESTSPNYHPDYFDKSENLFFILENKNRFAEGKGTYFVIEKDEEMVCSAGWNEYELDPTIALGFTRLFVPEIHRKNFYASQYLTDKIINDTQNYDKLWLGHGQEAIHVYNRYVYFYENGKNKYENYPNLYSRFKPIGEKEIYYSKQWVVEYIKPDIIGEIK